MAVSSLVSTEKPAVEQTAATKPAVDSKRREPSILALLIARVSSEVDPVGIEVAKKDALQGDRANRVEINPKGFRSS